MPGDGRTTETHRTCKESHLPRWSGAPRAAAGLHRYRASR